MKRLTLYLLGILTMMLMCAALFLSGAIYDAWNKSQTETYFFQPNNLSSQRPGVPAGPEDLGESKMRDRLIQKFITEYFYVWPGDDNIERRAAVNGALYWLSTRNVLAGWVDTIAPEIQQMSNNRMLRTVTVDTNTIFRPTESNYWSVEYELKTWTTPNDPDATPEIQRGRMFLQIEYRPGIPTSVVEYGIHDLLENGGDPVMLFRFKVMDVIQG